MPGKQKKTITKVVVHMYKMGTGDCFVLKFMAGKKTFNMVIDCGCFNLKYEKILPFIKKLKKDVNNHIHALVITHEHDDHVRGFAAGKALFTDPKFKIDRIWMGWPENDDDETGTVQDWKKKYGEQKMALAAAAGQLKGVVKSDDFKKQFEGARDGKNMLELRNNFVGVLEDFVSLHGVYKGMLSGMKVVKEQIANDNVNIKYCKPGEVLKDIPGLDGVRIFVLGPPLDHSEVEAEPEDPEDVYEHNKGLSDIDLFVHALNAPSGSELDPGLSPFDRSYTLDEVRKNKNEREKYKDSKVINKDGKYSEYVDPDKAWRRIDHDWLFSSGNLALRLEKMTNNLTLCLAIEFEKSGKVLLFPGDAEFSSWKSWHKIDWQKEAGINIKTKDLLNKVIFYKVAHHSSHNGTARELGLDMMIHKDLCAMVPLDYEVISSSWTSTMPNRMLLKELLEKTKGRTIFMNEKDISYDLSGEVALSDKIKESRAKMTKAERKAFKTRSYKHYVKYTLTL